MQRVVAHQEETAEGADEAGEGEGEGAGDRLARVQAARGRRRGEGALGVRRKADDANPAALRRQALGFAAGGESERRVVRDVGEDAARGRDVEIGIEGKEVTVNGARVVMPDVSTSNGIVHVIDEVLIPPAK